MRKRAGFVTVRVSFPTSPLHHVPSFVVDDPRGALGQQYIAPNVQKIVPPAVVNAIAPKMSCVDVPIGERNESGHRRERDQDDHPGRIHPDGCLTSEHCLHHPEGKDDGPKRNRQAEEDDRCG